MLYVCRAVGVVSIEIVPVTLQHRPTVMKMRLMYPN